MMMRGKYLRTLEAQKTELPCSAPHLKKARYWLTGTKSKKGRENVIKRNPFYTVSLTVPATPALTYTIVKNFAAWRDIYMSSVSNKKAGVKGIERVKSLSP